MSPLSRCRASPHQPNRALGSPRDIRVQTHGYPISLIGTILVETLATTVTPGIASITEEVATSCPNYPSRNGRFPWRRKSRALMNRAGKAATCRDSRSFGRLSDITGGPGRYYKLRDGRWGVWRPGVAPQAKRPDRTARTRSPSLTRGGKNQPTCAKKCDSP